MYIHTDMTTVYINYTAYNTQYTLYNIQYIQYTKEYKKNTKICQINFVFFAFVTAQHVHTLVPCSYIIYIYYIYIYI